MINRRDAIKTIGGLAGVAGLARILPACGGSDPVGIKHYVYLMMENRSFDHLLGARGLVEGLPGDGLRAGMSNLDLNGTPVGIFEPTKDQLCDLDPPHGWDAGRVQWNSGANDGFLKAHQTDHPGDIACMQYLTRTEVPVSWALADAYTSCDRWFCSVLGPTWPNRFYWMTASSGGLMSNVLPASGMLTWPSIFNRMKDKNVDWAYYYGTIPVLSALNNPGPYQLPADYVMPRIRRFSQFMTDAAAGKLPSVTYIDPAFFQNDDHPPIHPINGQELISAVYTALAQSPQWKNCLLVVTYDENGGFYDHVSPPQTADDMAATGFGQLGFRVPTIVAGPYVKTANISSVQYDHSSALKELQNVFGLENLNARTDAAVDLTDCLDIDRLAKGKWAPPIELPTITVDAWPMAQNCFGTGREVDPVTAWADAHPEQVAGLDLRDEVPQYRQTIRDFLTRAGKVITR